MQIESVRLRLQQYTTTAKMPKAVRKKSNASNGSPYGEKTEKSAKAKMGNSIFKMNTDLG